MRWFKRKGVPGMKLDGYKQQMMEDRVRLLKCDSPSGYTQKVLEMTCSIAQ